MKTEKNLERVLNNKGWELVWKEYSYWNTIPYAIKGEKEIALCFSTENTKYQTCSIITVLQMDMKTKELDFLLDKMENLINTKPNYLVNHLNLGNITYIGNKTIVEHTYTHFE